MILAYENTKVLSTLIDMKNAGLELTGLNERSAFLLLMMKGIYKVFEGLSPTVIESLFV